MDEIDRACERMENFTAAALQSVLNRLMDTPPSSGVCKSCHDVIDPQRLRANPKARHCRDCADEEEARSRRKALCGPR